ncbi:MAG: FAD-binding oxidoreductase [Actinobacteria bacterium]|nr:FAD-binding oxidoreductase [Actinomycetota bacterium]
MSGSEGGDPRILLRGTSEYDRARRDATWNALLPDRFPEAIVQARGEADVVAAVRFAREQGLQVKARSGGHSWTASSIRDRSVLVDLGALDEIDYTPGAATVAVGPGVHGQQLNRALEDHGFFFPTGHCSTVALGGFLLQGGWGWNSRSVGPACLSIEAVDVVNAAGELIHASREENPDFWWAARGAGPGYFGIVTRFQLRLHRRPAAMRRSLYIYPLELRREVLGWAYEVGPRLAPELEFSLLATTPRPPGAAPGEKNTALIVNAHALMADADAARAALEIIDTCPVAGRALHRETQVETSFDELYSRSDAMEEKGYRWCADNVWTDAGIEDLLPAMDDLLTTVPTAVSHVLWYQWHRQEFPDAATSLQGNLYLAAYSGWTDPAEDERMVRWPRERMASLDATSNGTALADENLVARPARFMSEENERRLEQLRRRHDPDQLFASYLRGQAGHPPTIKRQGAS